MTDLKLIDFLLHANLALVEFLVLNISSHGLIKS